MATITLPDDLAEKAEALDLLTPKALESYVRFRRQVITPPRKKMSDEAFARLINFAKEHKITLGDDITLKELITEGRR